MHASNYKQQNYKVDDVILLNAALDYQLSNSLNLALTAHNLLDAEYQQGGTTLHPYPQAGRNVRATLSYEF